MYFIGRCLLQNLVVRSKRIPFEMNTNESRIIDSVSSRPLCVCVCTKKIKHAKRSIYPPTYYPFLGYIMTIKVIVLRIARIAKGCFSLVFVKCLEQKVAS